MISRTFNHKTALQIVILAVCGITVLMLGMGAPLSASAADNAPAKQTSGVSTGDSDASNAPTGFVSLTQLPGVEDAAKTSTLPNFLNSLYKICIGVGAVLAVLMIMYAGFLFMTSRGSVSSNEKAKSYIQNAVLGLILLLSPTIVFSIINPDILKLDLNFDELKLRSLTDVEVGSNTPGGFTGADAYLWEHSGNPDDDLKRCNISGGTLKYECRKKDESGGRYVSKLDTCGEDEKKYNVCLPGDDAPMTQGQCNAKFDQKNVRVWSIDNNNSSAGNVCDASKGAVAIPHGCCFGSAASGNICCAIPKGAEQNEDTPEQKTALNWMWRMNFAKAFPSGEHGTPSTHEGGPFATQQECTVSLNSFIDANPDYDVMSEGMQCNCSKPKNEFGGNC